MRIRQWRGTRNAISGPGIREDEFQIDQNSERFRQGSWKRRKGMRHTDVAQQAGPITAILGWDLPGVSFATLLISGAEIHGFVDVDEA